MATEFINIDNLSNKDILCAAGLVSFKTHSFILDETGADAPVLGAAPTNVPSDPARDATVIEVYDDLLRLWLFISGTGLWTHKSDVNLLDTTTASNIGSDGLGVFKAKVLDDLEFYHVAPADAKITVVQNGNDLDIGFGVVAFNDLSNVIAPSPTVGDTTTWNGTNWVNSAPLQFGAYQTTFDASGGAFPTTTTSGDWFNTTVAGTVDGEAFSIGDTLIAIVNTPSLVTFAGNWAKISPIGSFTQFDVDGDTGTTQTLTDANTLSILGGVAANTVVSATDTITVNLDINKLTTDTIVAADTLAFYDDSGSDTNKVAFSAFEAALTHDNVSGVVANEHVDHSAVDIIAGAGLSGGGDLTLDRTLDLDINSLTVDAGATADEIAIYDASAPGIKKMTLAGLQTLIDTDTQRGVTDQANGLDLTLNVNDIEIAYDFTELSNVVTPDIAVDRLILYDDSGTTHGYITPDQIASINAPDYIQATVGTPTAYDFTTGYTKLTGFSTDENSNNCTVNGGGDTITYSGVTGKLGTLTCIFNISPGANPLTSGSFAFHKGGVLIVGGARLAGIVSTTAFSVSITTELVLTNADTFDIRALAGSAATGWTIDTGRFTLSAK